MQNPLDQFRRNSQTTSNPSTNDTQDDMKKPYLAFESKKGVDSKSAEGRLAPDDSFEIRRLLEPWIAPEWRHYTFLLYNGKFATKLTLFYLYMRVEIEGANLQNLITAIRKKTVVYIQDFHAKEFLHVPKGEPVITSILIKFRKNGDEQEAMDEMRENGIKETVK
jgi:hypothetical protein